jgi:hypothetical protein
LTRYGSEYAISSFEGCLIPLTGAAAPTRTVFPSIAGNALTPAGAFVDHRVEPSFVEKA